MVIVGPQKNVRFKNQGPVEIYLRKDWGSLTPTCFKYSYALNNPDVFQIFLRTK
jgi:hypothetical protein